MGSCIPITFLFASTTILVGSIPTNFTGDQVQPTESELTITCGNSCEYEEWFSRAHCDARGLTFVPRCAGCEGAILLELQENSIQSIPPERIAEYYHVKTLDISWNQIDVLDPGTFIHLSHLKNIVCSHNSLHIVQNGLFNGTEQTLSRIYLNNNNIYIIGDKAFKKLSQLIAIYLNNNHIRSLPQNVFSDVTNIKYLILSDNDLDYVDSYQFKGLIKLQYLSLDGNNLRIIPEGLFTGLESLKEVLLSHNKLITIPAPQILGLPFHLDRLDLRNNHLNQSAAVIPYLTNVNWTVYLEENPYICDCSFQSIQNWFNATWHAQGALNTVPVNSLKCTFTDGAIYSMNHSLPITCSTTSKQNSTLFDYTTTPTTFKRDNNNMITTSLQINLNFTELRSNSISVEQDSGRQVTTFVPLASCSGITIATFIVLVIFFALWISSKIFHIKTKGEKGSLSNGNGCQDDTKPLNVESLL
ncbi:Platelet glycoprotein V [Holothuria leucospilota]|uniref:Platelet glycoprotein V n=1 Tax=Holothuria leucospilota TaxID=206669 RepID=A0A9Q1BIH8_HOLLE|nr:Platelet glycoprotein V [Holothuria leucospilota]